MMNRNVKIAKQLVKLAKNLVAFDPDDFFDEFDEKIRNTGGIHRPDPVITKDVYGEETVYWDYLQEAYRKGKKYVLLRKENGLWRIVACRPISNISLRVGSLGGLIESEKNLSHDGDCWIGGDAKVYGDAEVYGNAIVYGDAQVYGNAKVYGYTGVFDDAQVYGDAEVYGKAWVYGNAEVYGKAHVFGNARVYGKARVDYEVSEGRVTE